MKNQISYNLRQYRIPGFAKSSWVKTPLYKWFSLFSELRNEARAHGIPSADAKSLICYNLDESLKLVSENLSLFKIPWVYIKKNMIGTFRLTPLNEFFNKAEIQNKLNSQLIKDGVYLVVEEPLRIDVLESTAEALDFYLPNGNFKSKTYETISYISEKKIKGRRRITSPGHGKVSLMMATKYQSYPNWNCFKLLKILLIVMKIG